MLGIDCSVTREIIFFDEGGADAQHVSDYVRDHRLLTPPHWNFETANGYLMACRRKR
ncbi:MAG: hypothetical protein ABI579_00510 [Candidatus Sumerlaeota bacterium]